MRNHSHLHFTDIHSGRMINRLRTFEARFPAARALSGFNWTISLHMIFGEPSQNSGMSMAENWNRFNFSSAMFPC